MRTLTKKDLITKLWYLYSEIPQDQLKQELKRAFDEWGFFKLD